MDLLYGSSSRELNHSRKNSWSSLQVISLYSPKFCLTRTSLTAALPFLNFGYAILTCGRPLPFLDVLTSLCRLLLKCIIANMCLWKIIKSCSLQLQFHQSGCEILHLENLLQQNKFDSCTMSRNKINHPSPHMH